MVSGTDARTGPVANPGKIDFLEVVSSLWKKGIGRTADLRQTGQAFPVFGGTVEKVLRMQNTCSRSVGLHCLK